MTALWASTHHHVAVEERPRADAPLEADRAGLALVGGAALDEHERRADAEGLHRRRGHELDDASLAARLVLHAVLRAPLLSRGLPPGPLPFPARALSLLPRPLAHAHFSAGPSERIGFRLPLTAVELDIDLAMLHARTPSEARVEPAEPAEWALRCLWMPTRLIASHLGLGAHSGFADSFLAPGSPHRSALRPAPQAARRTEW